MNFVVVIEIIAFFQCLLCLENNPKRRLQSSTSQQRQRSLLKKQLVHRVPSQAKYKPISLDYSASPLLGLLLYPDIFNQIIAFVNDEDTDMFLHILNYRDITYYSEKYNFKGEGKFFLERNYYSIAPFFGTCKNFWNIYKQSPDLNAIMILERHSELFFALHQVLYDENLALFDVDFRHLLPVTLYFLFERLEQLEVEPIEIPKDLELGQISMCDAILCNLLLLENISHCALEEGFNLFEVLDLPIDQNLHNELALIFPKLVIQPSWTRRQLINRFLDLLLQFLDLYSITADVHTLKVFFLKWLNLSILLQPLRLREIGSRKTFLEKSYHSLVTQVATLLAVFFFYVLVKSN